MYEHRHEPLLPKPLFFRRLACHVTLGIGILMGCLAIGMAGYHFLESQSWVDAFANAAMILSGMGPLNPLKTTAGKLFAGSYAIFSGVAFLTTVGFFLAPIAHRVLHKFHFDSKR